LELADPTYYVWPVDVSYARERYILGLAEGSNCERATKRPT